MALWQFAYRQNSNLPTPGYKHAFTQWEVQEFAKCKRDPIYFIKTYVQIITLDKGKQPFALYPFQEKLIRSYHEKRRTIVLSGRQIGKTQTAAAYFCWWLIFNSENTGVILANKAAQAREIIARIQIAFENLPMFLKKGVVTWNKSTIELDGNIRVFAASTSSSSVRGITAGIIYLDEFAHVLNTVAEDFWTSTYPVLSSGQKSKVIITSTPLGYNLFHKFWKEALKGTNGFNPLEVHWSEVPGRDEKWKKEQLQVLGQDKWAQEFEAEFLGSTNTLINAKYIKMMVDDMPLSNTGGLTVYQKHEALRKYIVVVDPSEGTGNDDHGVVVFDITTFPIRIVAKFKDNTLSHLVLPQVVEKLARTYNEAWVLVETNNNGSQVVNSLWDDLEYENVVQTQAREFGTNGNKLQRGVKTTKRVKTQGCSLFKDMIENQKLLINDLDLISQISNFVSIKNSWGAAEGEKDDLVMCCVLLAWFCSTQEFKNLFDDSLQAQLQRQNKERIYEEMIPFGVIDTGLAEVFSFSADKEETEFLGWLFDN